MEKINAENIIKSFFLGLFIGTILLIFNNADVLFEYKVMTVLASGSIGFIIGFVTEWLTSILPISLANARIYFFINNLIAVIVATLVMVSLAFIGTESIRALIPILLIVLGVICIANLLDYMMYRRAQNRLKTFKSSIKDE